MGIRPGGGHRPGRLAAAGSGPARKVHRSSPHRLAGRHRGPVQRLRRDGRFGSTFGTARGRVRSQPVDVEAPITVSLGEICRVTSRTVELPGGRRVVVKVPGRRQGGHRAQGARACGRRCRSRPTRCSHAKARTSAWSVPVPLHIALPSGQVAAPTLKGGQVKFKVPPEAQNRTRVRLRALGLPDPKGGPPGGMSAEVRVHLPVPIDQATRK